MSHNTSYAQTMDYGAELTHPARHLRALLAEAHSADNAPPPDGGSLEKWAEEMVQRDAAITRCALAMAHQLLKRVNPVFVPSDDEVFREIEVAMEWIWRA